MEDVYELKNRKAIVVGAGASISGCRLATLPVATYGLNEVNKMYRGINAQKKKASKDRSKSKEAKKSRKRNAKRK